MQAEADPPRRRRTVLRLLVGLGLGLLLWWGSGFVFAYTDDAYLTSDFVRIAPEVTGPIVSVLVHDNQVMRRGQTLFVIDPLPFRLALAQARATAAQARAQLPVDGALLASAIADKQAAEAEAALAALTEARARALVGTGDTPLQTLDDATTAHRRAISRLQAATASVLKVQQQQRMHVAAIDVAEAAEALAQWRLDRTMVLAPTDGPVSNLRLRVGDMAITDEPRLGIVDAHAWRVEANYKEYVLRHLYPGQRAWVWLDAVPWRLYRARIEGVSHAVGRETEPLGVLPYVSPSIDWIRLDRRFPVHIVLEDPPPGRHLFMGSDARVIVFY